MAARLFVRYNRQDAGVLWLVAKQDSPSLGLGLSPLDCATASREHLGSLWQPARDAWHRGRAF